MVDLSTLNASRKAEREAIAAEFIRIAEAQGATIERRDEPRCVGYGGASISLNFALEGVGAQVCISDIHGGDYGLISWFNQSDPSRSPMRRRVRDFASGFNTAVGAAGSLRPHHKATSGADWALLAARLQAGLRHARKGTAFRD